VKVFDGKAYVERFAAARRPGRDINAEKQALFFCNSFHNIGSSGSIFAGRFGELSLM